MNFTTCLTYRHKLKESELENVGRTNLQKHSYSFHNNLTQMYHKMMKFPKNMCPTFLYTYEIMFVLLLIKVQQKHQENQEI